MDSKVIKSAGDFLDDARVFDLAAFGSVFRGQGTPGKLLPGVARANPKENTEDRERLALAELRRMGSRFIPKGESDLELMVRAQHFGLKTRLLDWTSSVLVALWFACMSREVGDVYVYELAVMREQMGLNESETDPFTIQRTSLFAPTLNNDRILAQHGWFTLHRYSKTDGRWVALEKNKEMKEHLIEYVVPKDRRAPIIDQLQVNGISASTLFPDLGGLCQDLNRRHDLR